MQTTVGECRGKIFGCKLGALQRAFRELAILRQGGDALIIPNFPFGSSCEIVGDYVKN